ncbi:MAG: hypothetical protein HN509_09335 [Halobacteriovoraceae bacterium]|jgi:hypothetical protein|nr:hypothetical protein [Halobacteriovoraceae bacterium]
MKKLILVLLAFALVSPLYAVEKKTDDCGDLLSEQARKSKAAKIESGEEKKESERTEKKAE